MNNLNFRPGDTIRVYEKIKEGDKTRLLPFEGVVIAIRGSGINQSFTVRKIATGGIGVERIWPIHCPSISKIVVKKRGKTRRAKLYYLRKRIGKEALVVKEEKNKEKRKDEVLVSESPLEVEKLQKENKNVKNKPS